MLISKKFLLFNIDYTMEAQNFFVKENGILKRDFTCPLCEYESKAVMPVDFSEFLGKEIEITSKDGEIIEPEQTDNPVLPELYSEKLRPLVHFCAKRGWINDPNGLYFNNGLYHMFFQHNPYNTKWGNMHWQHAISRDCVRWWEVGTALYPDETGTMFSGSAIVKENTAYLFYTSAGGTSELSSNKPFTQCIATSTDGLHFNKFKDNPIIDHIKGTNRDPKVIYVEELKAYLLALYIDGNDFMLLKSEDLINWEKYIEYTISGGSECPDIFPLEITI